MKHLPLLSLVFIGAISLTASETPLAASTAINLNPVELNTKLVRVIDPNANHWMQWANWVESKVQITNSSGHGPDIGGDEWIRAVDRKLKISSNGHGPDLASKEWRQAVEAKLKLKPTPKPLVKTEIWTVESNYKNCTGLMPMKCLMITKSGGTSEFFYDSIAGFKYQEGFKYKIKVQITSVANPPADGSSFKYKLIKIIEKKKVK